MPILLPRLTFGRSHPSNMKSNVTGSLDHLQSLKNSVLSSGLSPTRFAPPLEFLFLSHWGVEACWSQREASMPTRRERVPCSFFSKPSMTARLATERVWLALLMI